MTHMRFGLPGPIHQFLSTVTEPHPAIEDKNLRRRVRILLRLVLFYLITSLVVIALVIGLISADDLGTLLLFLIPCGLASILSLISYAFARSKRPVVAVYLTVVIAASVPYSAILVTPGAADAVKYAPLIVFTTLISGLFLNVRRTGLIALVTSIGLIGVLLIFQSVVTALFPDIVAENPAAVVMESFNFFITLVIVIGMNGCILLFMSLRDQLEQERLNERARAIEQEQIALAYKQADEVKSAFLASMSHELRTPLNASINFTRFVLEGDVGEVNAQQKEMLAEVISSSKHLLSLINDVLDISKIESGSLNLFVEEHINLGHILQKAVKTGSGLMAGKSVQLITEIPDELPTIRGDRQRLLQIFLNIISNACKFTDEGSIRVCAEQQAESIVIRVKDTGPGIAEAELPLVFQAFKQTDAGVRQGGGTGLGMPISRSLVEAHGGTIEVESTLGQGATFIVRLPIQSAQLAEQVVLLKKAS
jgi:signal transduction histidine kinase